MTNIPDLASENSVPQSKNETDSSHAVYDYSYRRKLVQPCTSEEIRRANILFDMALQNVHRALSSMQDLKLKNQLKNDLDAIVGLLTALRLHTQNL